MCSKDYKITIIEHEILNLWNLEMISLHLMFSWRQLLTFDSSTYVINPIPTFSSVHCECIIFFTPPLWQAKLSELTGEQTPYTA